MLEPLGHKDLRALLVTPVHKDHRALAATQEQLGHKDLRALLVTQDHKDRKAPAVHKDLQVLQDHKGLEDHRDLVVPKE
jgi:hypothetical protein